MKGFIALFLINIVAFVPNSQAATVLLDFESVSSTETLRNHYENVEIIGGYLHRDNVNVDNLPSGNSFLAMEDSTSETDTMLFNVRSGFESRFSFNFSSSSTTQVYAWSGLNSTGILVGQLSFGRNRDDGCTSANFCNWDFFSMSLADLARSIQFVGLGQRFGIDDVEFQSINSSVVATPLPASFVLFGSAFLGILGFKRVSKKRMLRQYGN